MAVTPERPSKAASQNAGTPTPIGETTPKPVMTTRAGIIRSNYRNGVLLTEGYRRVKKTPFSLDEVTRTVVEDSMPRFDDKTVDTGSEAVRPCPSIRSRIAPVILQRYRPILLRLAPSFHRDTLNYLSPLRFEQGLAPMSINSKTLAPYEESLSLVKQVCYYWLPVILHAGSIIFVSSLSSLPRTLPLGLDHVSDKIWHAAEYAVLGILVYRALFYAAGSRLRSMACPLAILAAGLFGLTDELHQWFVPNRQADGWDLLADTIGAAAAVGMWRWIGLVP
ncbi:MAG: VanZ family protein, partial [Nitrospirae bacterium]